MGVAATSAATVRDEVAELLGISPDTLDPQADLIASGLDSIRMMTLSGRWRKQGIDVGFAALAARPTVAAWMDLVAERGAPAAAPDVAATSAVTEEADSSEPFPLAPIQHALWVGRNTDQELGGVAAHLYVEFDGHHVDPDRLRAAAHALSDRHPMLRVDILPDGTQRISDRALVPKVTDLRHLDDDAAAEALDAIRDRKSHQILDGEVLELGLTLLPEGRTRVHVDLDMQAADAVSYRNFTADLAVLYAGVPLPELGYTYRQYRAAFTAAHPEPTAEDRQWWAQRIPELPEPPAPPLVPAAEQQNPRRNTRRHHFFGAAAKESLFAAAQRRGITPAMAVAASYAGVLRRWSTNSRFLLNLPMFGREPYHADVEKLVGDFTSSLMLDIDLTNTRTAAERAQVVQDSLHSTAQHSSYSGLSVLRDLTRHRGTQALAPFVFTSALGLGDLFAGDVTEQFGSPVWHISQGPQVLLDAQITPFDGGLLLNWDVREDAFRPGVIDAMFAYHLAELNRLAADDDAWDLPDPPAVPADQQQIRDALNTVRSAPSGDALHDGFFRAAAAHPDAPAVISSLGDFSYAQLREQALAITATLRQRGVAPGDVVAVMGPKTAEQIPALLAIHAAGAAYLPIGVDQPADRARRILRTAGVQSVLLCGNHVESLPIPVMTVADAIEQGLPLAASTEPARTDPAELAYILFTSGSTGEPKGVEVTHDAAMNTVEFINRHFEIGPLDRNLALSTLEGDLSVLDIFGMLRAGASIVTVDEQDRRNPDAWARMISDYRVTVLHFMPGWLEMLVQVSRGELRSVRVVPTGGDWVRPELVRALRAQAPGVRVAGLGGATETATHNTMCEPGELPVNWAAVPMGRPLPNNACRVVAADGTDCPDWVPGEFWVSGRGVAAGYRGRPDLTAQRFVQHDGRTWYRTGDLVRYLPDGAVDFVGRLDHRVKVSGYRIELGEVEGAFNRLDGVAGAVATLLAVPGDRDGQHQLGAVVHVTDPALTVQRLAEAVAKFVPAHMVPKTIVLTEEVPFTVGGKIDRRAVATVLENELAHHPDPQEAAGTAPSTTLERALAHIVSEILRRETVGVDDDFFSLGGDSVLATQTVARIREWLDAPNVAVADVFAARTVAALADVLVAQENGTARLEGVAELYLEVSEMETADVLTALDSSSAP
ncbi:phenyloxazoline synthase MbtB [soil metagenome]